MTRLITLIPNSGVQFWDIDLDLEKLPRLRRSFWDEPIGDQPDESGNLPLVLRELQDKDGILVDPVSGQVPPDDQVYPIGPNQALDLHMNRFVPLPYFQVRGRGQRGEQIYERGPTNWVRGRLTRHPDPDQDKTLRLTLAFDTALIKREGEAHYVGPSPEDSERQREFAFVAGTEINSWYLDEAWVSDWLEDMRVQMITDRRGRPPRDEEMLPVLEHYARHIVFLALLEAADVMPRVKLQDVVSGNLAYVPVMVDLVLDIGNARTCGILIEEHPGQGINLADSYALALRDLSRPELHKYAEPFPSRIEFAFAAFGSEGISRRSGRGGAFSWPSPVRVGPEAVRLAGEDRIGNEGATGLSSPKRYLWDERASTQSWRFNGKGPDGVTKDPPVGGVVTKFVTQDGNLVGRDRTPAGSPRFSRSSLFTFMLTEILMQALNQINAPDNRAGRKDVETPRRLRSLILTLPPGMPVREQKILQTRAKAAMRLTWDLLGWTGILQEPRVKADLDEATATQIVWLHNEVSVRLQGDADSLLQMMGQTRQPDRAASLRIASIDIGGGTTDLMITTYTLSGAALIPQQNFRESFKVAGDDVLERVITGIVLPAIETALEEAGVGDGKALLSRNLGQDRGGQSEQDRHLRRLFVSRVLEPIGLAILHAYEETTSRVPADVLGATIGELLGADLATARRSLNYLESAANAAGARDFQASDIRLSAGSRQIERVTSAVLGQIMADLCEVVATYDCDVLLLSGRPSRMRVVTDMVLAKTPVAPHRIIGMHLYKVGETYPFRDGASRIKDPKTTAAVGAALFGQAEGRLQNFTLRTREMKMQSTARIIGKMDNNGQIRTQNELLRDLDLDRPPKGEVGFTLDFEMVTQLGFRQLPIERWVTTPLYILEFANPENAGRLRLPLKVKVLRREVDDDDNPDPAAMEDFKIEEIQDAEGGNHPARLLNLRLQTIREQDGYWRDTGRLSDI